MNLKQLIILNFIFVFILFSIMGGFAMNKHAIESNRQKMPVLSPYSWEKSTHFTFQDFSEINAERYVDRYQIGNRVYSIGDFLMLNGVFIMILLQLYIAKEIIKKYKRRKNEKQLI